MTESNDVPALEETSPQGRHLARLSLLALGVIYGDIGTSPLYALRECFNAEHGVGVSRANVLGILSLVLWTLVVVITIKYHVYVIRATNRGEGGILALMTLARSIVRSRRLAIALVSLGIFGAALLYADGALTPAISVLSAVEGLKIATPFFVPYIVPITVAVLVGLFLIQHHGTGRIGSVFGPVMILWFSTLAILGIVGIAREPSVLAAVNPWQAFHFLTTNGTTGFLVLGAVFLVATGGEALYADLGHFGEKPVQIDWFCFVGPALLLNYFGQGALLIERPEAAVNPFYLLAPSWALYPLVVLATAATIIASQAVITGVFSLTMQAVQLGYLPRVRGEHTSARTRGQIYVGSVNWLLMLMTIGLVLGFQSSSAMAGAYGIAIAATMVITTLLAFPVAWKQWRWGLPLALAVTIIFLSIDLVFFSANIVKVVQGGWFPLAVGGLIYLGMSTWKRGREVLAERVRARLVPLTTFLEHLRYDMPVRVKGTAIFMSGNVEMVPIALLHNLKHNQVLHERVVFLTVQAEEIAHVAPADHLEHQLLTEGFHSVVARYGFMEEPDVPQLLKKCASKGLHFEMARTTFFLGRETILASRKPGMAIWREKLFALMTRNAQSATAYFRIPPERVIEVGSQVEM